MNDRAIAARRWASIVAAAFAMAVAADASAQLYKCKDASGKIVYSDRRCEATDTQGSVAPGVRNRAHEVEEKAAADKAAAEKAAEEARIQAEALVAAQKKLGVHPAASSPPANPSAPAAAAAVSAGSAGPYQPSGAERERIRGLEMTAGSVGASREQKTAAQLEIDSIRYGREARLSSADRARRDSLMVDLSSSDAKRRAEALREIRSIYNQ
jgi:hypothetical protein